MCYKNPGPRCSSYAQKRLDKFSKAMREDPDNFSAYEDYRKAEEDFNITPAGLKQLKAVAENTDPEYQEKAQERYEFHLQKRKDALASIGRADKVREEPVELAHHEPTDDATVKLDSSDENRVERKFPDARAVDPENCGCTECLTGQYVRLDDFKRNASSSDVEAFVSGELQNNTYQTTASVVNDTISERPEDDDIQGVTYLTERFDTAEDGTMTVQPLGGRDGSYVSIQPDGKLRLCEKNSYESEVILSENLSPRTWNKLHAALSEEWVSFNGRGSGDNDVQVFSSPDSKTVDVTVRDRESFSWDSSVTTTINRNAFTRMVAQTVSK